MKLGKRQKKWVSDIPKYEQAKGTLCDGNGFCCLGVYAHTQIKEPWVIEHGSWFYRANGEYNETSLDADSNDKLGLFSAMASFHCPDTHRVMKLYFNGKAYESLVELNDNTDITPDQMADFITANAKYIFTRSA